MNWTGGSRARNNRPSSDTTRIQKRYFAKVRAAQNSNLSHAGSQSNFGDEDASIGRKRKRPRIPDLDIVVSECSNQPRGSLKRKALNTPRESRPPGEISRARIATPASSFQTFRCEKGGNNELKTKKQLLLEKEDWVCTTLSRPLVLKGTTRSTKPSNHHKIVQGPINSGVQELSNDADPYALRFTGYPSLEKRSIGYVDTGKGGNRVFRNLSDGGYVQIGGSTQPENRDTLHNLDGRRSLGRELSHISEETMLLDMEVPLFRPSPVSNIPTRNSNIFEREYQRIGHPDYRNWSPVRDVSDGFPSSPLARYSLNINESELSAPRNCFFGKETENIQGLIEEIEEATAEVVSSSPSTVLSTIYVQPAPNPSSSRPYLPPVLNTQRTPEYHVRKPDLKSLVQEEVEITQNPSLIVYASSCSSSSSDEGENWILGSHVSPKASEASKTTNNDASLISSGNWGAFLNGDPADEDEGLEVGNTGAEYDAKKYLEEVGIWEKHSGLTGGNIEDGNDNEPGEVDDMHGEVADIEQVTGAPISREVDDGNLQGGSLASFITWPEEKEPWRDFVIGPLNNFGCTQKETTESELAPQILKAVNCHKDSPARDGQKEKAVYPAECQAANDNSRPLLELDKDEDSAWRMFVFDGLGDEKEEASFNPVKPPKMTSRVRAIRQNSDLVVLEAAPPEPQLPSAPTPSSSEIPLEAPSEVGATVGSGSSPNSGTHISAASSSPARRKSRLSVDNQSSSPLASPVALVKTRPELTRNTFEWKNGKNLYLDLLSRNLQIKSKVKDENLYDPEDETEDIEEW